MRLRGKYRRHGCIETARADRLADRRRKIRGQPDPVYGRMLRTDGRGGPAALAYRRFRPHAASRDLRPHFIWKPGAEVEIGTVDYHILELPDFHSSPLIIVFQQGLEVRARTDDAASMRFPIVEELRAEGVTDYIALPLPFIGGTVNASSWTTKQPGGFTDEQLSALRRVVKPLARVIEIISYPHRCEPAGYLCRQPRRRTDPRRPDQARPHRDHECRDLAVRPARLHLVVRSRAGGNRGRRPEPLFRLPGCRDPESWRRSLNCMGDGLLAVFPIDEYVGDEQQVCTRVSKPPGIPR